MKGLASIIYHDIFDYPLTPLELIKWTPGKKLKVKSDFGIEEKEGYLFLKGREGLIYKRTVKKRASERKLILAEKYTRILSFIPSIKMVAVTGALAMKNADEEADIDLMIIAKRGLVWTSRALALAILKLVGIPVRRFGEKDQKDKLCLNIWLDESSLVWPKKDRNAYTAHEIAQIIPLIDKDKNYEKFISKNSWIDGYWPNAASLRKDVKGRPGTWSALAIFEPIARALQFWYMRGKITREVVAKNRALFHPNDWGQIVLKKLAEVAKTPLDKS